MRSARNAGVCRAAGCLLAGAIILQTCVTLAAEQKLNPAGLDSFDYFGEAVAMHEDYLIVGAPGDDTWESEAGAAYVYSRSGGVWSLQAKLTAGDADFTDNFGEAVAIWEDRVLVGAPGDDEGGSQAGAVYFFERVGTTWILREKLMAGDLGVGTADFGSSVNLYLSRAVVGAYRDAERDTDGGAAYIYENDGSTWTLENKIMPSDAQAGGHFGSSVSLFGLGLYVIAGAPGHNGYRGQAYVFERTGSTWQEICKLAPADRAENDCFGQSVHGTYLGDYIVVGSPYDDIFSLWDDRGSAYVFVYQGGTWVLQDKLIPQLGSDDGQFGASVAIFYSSIAVGSPGWQTSAGAVYAFTRQDSDWLESGMRSVVLQGTVGRLGNALAMPSGEIVVGAKGLNSYSGAVYVSTISELFFFADGFETGNTSRWSSTASK